MFCCHRREEQGRCYHPRRQESSYRPLAVQCFSALSVVPCYHREELSHHHLMFRVLFCHQGRVNRLLMFCCHRREEQGRRYRRRGSKCRCYLKFSVEFLLRFRQ